MNGLLNAAFWLTATANLGRAFQTHSRRSTSGSNLFLFIGVAVGIVALLSGLYFWDRRKSKKKVETDSELILFRRLCKLHNLTSAETGLLQNLAESRNLNRRSDLFVNPEVLTAGATRGGSAKKFAELHKKLFGAAKTVT